MKKIILFLSLCVFCVPAAPVRAEEAMITALQQQVEALQGNVNSLKSTLVSQNDLIQKLVKRLDGLESGTASAVSSGGSGDAGARPENAPALRGLSQGLNPDIGVTGTVQAKLTESSEDEEGNDTIALKELELSFAQYVDPYSRLDAIVTLNDNLEEQNVDIEEAYYTHWGLPWGFRGQVGKFRAKIGKQNLQHLHALDTADYAEVIKDFFGEEGLASSGLRLVNDIPNPFDIPLEVTGEILRGNNGNSFSGISRRPIFNAHAKTFFQTSDNSNLELGWTTLFGDENPAKFSHTDGDTGEDILAAHPDGRSEYGVKVYGADATFNWLLSEGRALKFQNELYFQNRGELVHANHNPWGFYSLIDYRLSKRFSIGARFDYVEPLDIADEHGRTTGISPYITFWQSEFANMRLQYTHLDPAGAEGISDDAVYLEINFMIGAHRHPVN